MTGLSRTTFYGHLPSGEIFNWSLWASEAPIGQAATQAQATAFATEFKADPGVNMPGWKLIGSDSGYDGCRVYSYQDTSGKATNIADAGINMVGSSSATSLLPNQCALVASLKTAVAGRRHQGRVYLPINKFALGSQGQLDTPTALSVAAWMADLIHRLNTHITPAKIGILSRVSLGAGAPTDAIQPVTTVTVDTKIDIQRRRAKSAAAGGRGIVTVT